jgi:5-(carboxyamino)imidazole ribonucleotide mutase
MGSQSDWPTMQAACETLERLGVGCQARILSAHRTPRRTAEFAAGAAGRGLRVIIAAAGGAAHLAGAIAAQTTLPVIGVPLAATPLAGLDALLATVQMPAGIPVATVAIGGAANAAWLAASMLALSDPVLAGRLQAAREDLAGKVAAQDEALRVRRPPPTG